MEESTTPDPCQQMQNCLGSCKLQGSTSLLQEAKFVDASDIEFSLHLWHLYVTNRAMIEAAFYKYNADQSERLEHIRNWLLSDCL